MKTSRITDFKAGWFIGDFEPTLLKTKEFEVAHHHYKAGTKSTPHYHAIATEYNYIVRGWLNAGGEDLMSGDIFIYEPNDVAQVEFLADTDLIIIKTPSVVGDKYDA